MIAALRRARSHLAGGWSGPGEFEPLCRNTEGAFCGSDSEGVARFSVDGALRLACGADSELLLASLRALERIATPGWAAFEDFVASQPGGVLPEFSERTFWAWLRAQLLARACTGPTFEVWLMARERTLREMLAVFDKAIQRARLERAA